MTVLNKINKYVFFKLELTLVSTQMTIVKMIARRLKDPPVFVALIFLFIFFVIYASHSNKKIIVTMPQIETKNDFVFRPSEVKTNHNKTRLNVILLTHMSSGSTVMGKMFNIHPDVFYIYEPLNALRRRMGKK